MESQYCEVSNSLTIVVYNLIRKGITIGNDLEVQAS